MAGAIFNTVPPLAAGPGIKFDGERISTAAAPRNLLDNSDFRNPVMQAGFCGNHGAYKYPVDRWFDEYGFGTFTQTAQGITVGYGTNDGYLTQKLPDGVLQAGKTYTLAFMDFSGNIRMNSGKYTANAESIKVPVDAHIECRLKPGVVTFVATAGSVGITWVALYEGEYTAETLPEYQPKGYGAELAECQRYYLHDVGMRCVGSVLSDAKVVLNISTPVAFRTAPSVVARTLDNVICNLGSAQIIALKSVSNVEVRTNCIVVYFNTSLAAGELQWSTVCSYSTNIDLVADL